MAPGPGPLPAPAPSDRVRIARLAREAALGVPGVAGATAGRSGIAVTADPVGGRRRTGVTVAAAPNGRYDVALRLVARPVPLTALAVEVRRSAMRAAAAAGLAERIGDVDIEIADVVSDAEASALVAAEAAATTTAPVVGP